MGLSFPDSCVGNAGASASVTLKSSLMANPSHGLVRVRPESPFAAAQFAPARTAQAPMRTGIARLDHAATCIRSPLAAAGHQAASMVKT